MFVCVRLLTAVELLIISGATVILNVGLSDTVIGGMVLPGGFVSALAKNGGNSSSEKNSNDPLDV